MKYALIATGFLTCLALALSAGRWMAKQDALRRTDLSSPHDAQASGALALNSPDTAASITPPRGASAPEPPKTKTVSIDITAGSTFSDLMKEAGMRDADIAAIYAAAKTVYDLANVRVGKSLKLVSDVEVAAGDIKELIYPIDADTELHVLRTESGWEAQKKVIAYEIRQKTVHGSVTSSLYASALAAGADERAVIALADVFQWSIDFAQDVRSGDSFNVIYEERYRDGIFAMPGDILAAEYVNAGTKYTAFRFVNTAGDVGYYDEDGASLRKLFLKAPVAFKYMTSGFTTGMRYVSAFNTATRHRAIDYAAKVGTPIRATAAGTVTRSGWNGPYGNFVSIRHNATYSTNYAHQSRIAVKKGQKVAQGQIIGYVGSTGFSTGPHLHYEMVKNGTKINPLKEKFPAADPVTGEEKEAFAGVVKEWQPELAKR